MSLCFSFLRGKKPVSWVGGRRLAPRSFVAHRQARCRRRPPLAPQKGLATAVAAKAAGVPSPFGRGVGWRGV